MSVRNKKKKLQRKNPESLQGKFIRITRIGANKNAYYELGEKGKYKSILDRVDNVIYKDQDKSVRDRAMDCLTRALIAQG